VQGLVRPRALREKPRLRYRAGIALVLEHARDSRAQAVAYFGFGRGHDRAAVSRQIERGMEAGFVFFGGEKQRTEVQHHASGAVVEFLFGPWKNVAGLAVWLRNGMNLASPSVRCAACAPRSRSVFVDPTDTRSNASTSRLCSGVTLSSIEK